MSEMGMIKYRADTNKMSDMGKMAFLALYPRAAPMVSGGVCEGKIVQKHASNINLPGGM
jgi:hypothetical protein